MVQRWSVIRRRKLLRLLAALMILILAAVIAVSAAKRAGGGVIRASTNEERLSYLSSLGWEAESTPLSEQTIQLPKPFPEVLRDYNELQKKQGFDLEKYGGKEVSMFTYRILNHPASGEVQCSLYQYKNRIVGGDIHSVAIDGFMTGLK